MNRRNGYAAMFLLGGICYGLIEILWRGSTHWTMLLTGGLCAALLHGLNRRYTSLDLWSKCGLGCLCITGVEFAVGCLVNLRLGLGVWDYSDRPLNVMGQVCAEYSGYWYFLSLPVFAASNYLLYRAAVSDPWQTDGYFHRAL